MKVLFVTQYFYPENFKGNDIAFELAKNGNEITVITSIPNYPVGKYYCGYNIIKRRKETINEVKVIRVPIIPRGHGGIKLAANYASYVITASLYCLYLCITQRYDIIFAQQLSPVTSVLPAILVKKIEKIPLYTWILDLWPESITSAGHIKNNMILNIFGKIVKYVYKNTDKILISSKGFEKSIIEKGDFKNRLVYFPNWAEDVFNNKLNYSIPEIPAGFIIMFAGNIGECQDFDNIMKAALMLRENEDIKIVIIGEGRKKEWVIEFVKENKLEKTVYLYTNYPIETMPTFFRKASLMLISLRNELIFNLTVPAKLQAYMASSKPIVGMLCGEGAEIVKEANCGIIANSGDYKKLANNILVMSKMSDSELKQLGKNGKDYYDKYFSKELCLSKLRNIMNIE